MIADNKKFGLGIGMMTAFFFVLALSASIAIISLGLAIATLRVLFSTDSGTTLYLIARFSGIRLSASGVGACLRTLSREIPEALLPDSSDTVALSLLSSTIKIYLLLLSDIIPSTFFKPNNHVPSS